MISDLMLDIARQFMLPMSVMARQWRIEFEGAYYHILSRGNERRNIFRDNDDRVSFLEILGMMSNRFEIEVCAYVLMDNHITYVKLHINGVMSPEIVI